MITEQNAIFLSQITMNCGYIDKETKNIAVYCSSRKLKVLQKLEVVHFNNFIQILKLKCEN